jgi:hypothetical protein
MSDPSYFLPGGVGSLCPPLLAKGNLMSWPRRYMTLWRGRYDCSRVPSASNSTVRLGQARCSVIVWLQSLSSLSASAMPVGVEGEHRADGVAVRAFEHLGGRTVARQMACYEARAITGI